MTVPETSVDKDDFAPRREHDVWTSRQITALERVAVPKPMQRVPKQEFWLGVLLADLRHDEGAAFGFNVIGHYPILVT